MNTRREIRVCHGSSRGSRSSAGAEAKGRLWRIPEGKLAAAALLLGLLAPIPAQADKYVWQQYDERLKASQDVAALKSDLFGDSVNLQNGSLSFSVTDISIPGNNDLRVELTRTFTVKDHGEFFFHDEMLSDWALETPTISGTFAPNWVSSGTPGKRCSDKLPPPEPMVDLVVFTLNEFWNGLSLNIPGVSSGDLLVTRPEAIRPDDGAAYHWVTSDQVHVSCLPAVKNASGEGFLAVTSDGTRYWFDWMAQHGERGIIKYTTNVSGLKSEVSISRRRNVLHATRVEDRFGNWVTYDYSNAWSQAGRLTRIASSDGREIVLTYDSATHNLKSASDGSRTWQYRYENTPKGVKTLSEVVRPDGSKWAYQFSEFSEAFIKYADSYKNGEPYRSCTGLEMPLNWMPGHDYPAEFAGVATHPSGASGLFTVKIHESGQTNVPLGCANFTGSLMENDPNDDINLFAISAHGLALRQKQISGPGLPVSTWDYNYVSQVSTYMYPGTTWEWPICVVGKQCFEPPCTSDDCAGTNQTIVAGPNNDWARYTFGNSFRYNEGKLLMVERGGGPSSIRETVVHTYDLDRSDKVYLARFGYAQRPTNDGFSSEYHRPLTRTVVTRDGTDFVHEVDAFDALARPVSVTRASSKAPPPPPPPAPPAPPPPPPPPMAPDAPTLAMPYGSVTVGFQYGVGWASVGADRYVLERKFNSGTYSVVHDGNGSTTTAILPAVAEGTYTHRIKACNSVGCSPYLAEYSIPAAEPSGGGGGGDPTDPPCCEQVNSVGTGKEEGVDG